MTLEQKIAQLHGSMETIDIYSITPDDVAETANQFDVKRHVAGDDELGIPRPRVTNGPVGVGMGDGAGSPKATSLPMTIGLAAGFDPALAAEYGDIIGSETATLGQHVLEGPGLCLHRMPTGGRDFEYFSEDPYLTGVLGRDEWGFDGYVQSDFWSARSAAASLHAGLDLEMPDAKWLNEDNVKAALHDTSLEIEAIDRALVRRFTQMFRFGHFDIEFDTGTIDARDHDQRACRLGGQLAVLLKNDDALLPLDPEAGEHPRGGAVGIRTAGNPRRQGQFPRRSSLHRRSG